MTDHELDALDEAVARIEGWAPHLEPLEHWLRQGSYCRDWAVGGPIIERERLDLYWTGADVLGWAAGMDIGSDGEMDHKRYGPTPLVAAMSAYIASKDTPHD